MQRMFFRIALVISLVIITAWAIGLAYISFFPEHNGPDASKDDGRISVVATTYPLAYFAMDLDPAADITVIVGSGVEPHDFEPSIDDVKRMQDAELLLVNGGIDAWAERGIEDGRNGPTVSALTELELSDVDPHFWLDPVYAEEMVRIIGAQLAFLDPTRAEVIRENVEMKVAALREVDAAYRAELQNCEIPEIVTAHEAFNFLANAYGFTAHGVTGMNPEEEPSAAGIAAVIDLVRERRITTVYFEEMASDELAVTIAQETGAKSDVLDPMESLTPGYDAATGYTEIMLANLEKLSDAMLCQR